MRGLKKGVSAALAAVLVLTALPTEGLSRVNAAERAAVDATMEMIPGKASTFNDTDLDGLGEFQGWGTSLCWWANRLGYSEKLTSEAAAKFYSDDGLDLNIGRYNVGGGDNVTGGEYAEENEFLHGAHIERSDSAVPGYCKDVTKMNLQEHDLAYYTANFARADETSGYAWNYNWTADKRQLAILSAAMKASGEDFIAEAFSNSPPYFMTNSGCSSGAQKSSEDNLRADCYKAFAAYMADVVVHWAKEGLVEFTSTTPMNEPYTSYWGANSPKQEGCHFDQGNSESTIIVEYNAELQRQLEATTDAKVKRALSNLIICGTDETSIDTAITSYNKLSADAKNIVQRIDTHTYGGSKRAELCDLAEREGKNLWMSEIDVGGKAGTNAGEMAPALCFAQRIITDLNGLKASAWIMWNAIDVHIDRNSTSKYDAKESIEEMKQLTYDDGTVMYDPSRAGYWGVAIADHNNQVIIPTKKYYAYGQFSRYIRPGYTIMGTSDEANTLIAYDSKGKKTVIVAINTSDSPKTWEFDLSQFKSMGSTVRAYRTSGTLDDGENWEEVTSVASVVADSVNRQLQVGLEPNSITTYIVEGTDYDVEQNYEMPEKVIKNQILPGIYAQNDAVMEANKGSVEAVALNEDMVSGSAPWNDGKTDVPQNVVDNNYDTFFDGVADGWVQIDLGTQENIAGFGYAPRSGYADRCVGASFYGSNDGQEWTKLCTIADTPAEKTLTNVYASRFDVPNYTSYQYIKYAVPQGDSSAACNVSEIAVYRWKPGVNVVFKEPAVPSDLRGWVAFYKGQTTGNTYSKESWAKFQAAMASAETLLKGGSTNVSEQSKARRALALAYLGLAPGSGEEPPVKPQKKNQTITYTKSYTKAYGDKAFKLNAKVKAGDGKLSYTSSNTKVAKYNKKTGKVEIKGIGQCVITITASETANYKKKTVKATITVNPKKLTLSSRNLKPGKKSLKVSWKKDAKADGYEIQLCLKKNFKSGVRKAAVKKAKTTSATVKKLKSGKKYYVRIRAYKKVKVSGKVKTLRGAWSKVVQSKKIK